MLLANVPVPLEASTGAPRRRSSLGRHCVPSSETPKAAERPSPETLGGPRSRHRWGRGAAAISHGGPLPCTAGAAGAPPCAGGSAAAPALGTPRTLAGARP
ncbi:hypothetical protein C2845_PM05G14960 [Panicum miliaceum]|uniref:Uncharacterized protein n=1 Tax=Panicum miliaceum TaxID=4540 RepID=A0A3L6T000_PANMI|nr:hypothetical protein C2845_PM05G14960 [Panicum miliaceum]